MIYGLTVGRNEEHRYLQPMMQAAAETFDALFFYDDQSTDNTAAIAFEYAYGDVRPNGVPSFAENEGAFREAAWDEFERIYAPSPEDWVCVIDCDEVLVGAGNLMTADALRNILEVEPCNAIDLAIPEVFGFDEQVPMVRIDGLWNTIHAPRLFRFAYHGSYYHGRYGVPAVPSYVMGWRWGSTTNLYLMHYGYADERDRQPKYDRYIGHTGHANKHVESILTPPVLETWHGSFDTRMRRHGER